MFFLFYLNTNNRISPQKNFNTFRLHMFPRCLYSVCMSWIDYVPIYRRKIFFFIYIFIYTCTNIVYVQRWSKAVLLCRFVYGYKTFCFFVQLSPFFPSQLRCVDSLGKIVGQTKRKYEVNKTKLWLLLLLFFVSRVHKRWNKNVKRMKITI